MSGSQNVSSTTARPIDKTGIQNPYLLGTIAILVITLLAMLLSVLVVCRRLHLFSYCSLFLVELAVGSLTTEAIVHLLPTIIKPPGEERKKGMPAYFPRLATVTAGVCLLHALDTASVVFVGRRQSTSHALEWREAGGGANGGESNHHQGSHPHHGHHRAGHNAGNGGGGASTSGGQKQEASRAARDNAGSVSSVESQHQKQQQMTHLRVSLVSNVTATDFGEELSDGKNEDELDDDEFDDADSLPPEQLTNPGADQQLGTSSAEAPPSEGSRVEFEDSSRTRDADGGGDITLRQALRRPRLCLQPGPYRLCSILSAGSILHSFADGIAIGAAFAKSWDAGLHLSVSVGMHELAHKMADFAVLTASGFTLQAVMLLNLCYLTSAMIGLMIAVPLSLKSEVLQAWIITIATAVFVYISLVTMSSMVRRNYIPRHTSAFFVGNLGMTSGFILIMLASMLEFYT